jgi:hypothetical protein
MASSPLTSYMKFQKNSYLMKTHNKKINPTAKGAAAYLKRYASNK